MKNFALQRSFTSNPQTKCQWTGKLSPQRLLMHRMRCSKCCHIPHVTGCQLVVALDPKCPLHFPCYRSAKVLTFGWEVADGFTGLTAAVDLGRRQLFVVFAGAVNQVEAKLVKRRSKKHSPCPFNGHVDVNRNISPGCSKRKNKPFFQKNWTSIFQERLISWLLRLFFHVLATAPQADIERLMTMESRQKCSTTEGGGQKTGNVTVAPLAPAFSSLASPTPPNLIKSNCNSRSIGFLIDDNDNKQRTSHFLRRLNSTAP